MWSDLKPARRSQVIGYALIIRLHGWPATGLTYRGVVHWRRVFRDLGVEPEKLVIGSHEK